MPTETSPADLAAASRAFVIAPAGFGKTELIARAIELSPGRSLILTHTHSGVNAIRERLQRYGVPREKFDVATIAGWGLRYVSAFPHLSGATFDLPTGPEWTRVYDATVRLLERRAAHDLIMRSFSGVFVDEYQDCSKQQHRIVLALAEILPCRLLGDPLQGIFDFAEPTIQWDTDVVPTFERLPDLVTPHRWLNTNEALGTWISTVRASLIAGEPITLTGGPLTWAERTAPNQLALCRSAGRDPGQTVVAIAKWPNDCHEFASRTGGLFSSMEELDCRALMQFVGALDADSDGFGQASLLIRFAAQCFTALAGPLATFREQYDRHATPDTGRLTTNLAVVESLNRVVGEPGARTLLAAARTFDRYPGARLYRRELWNEMKTTLGTFLSGGHGSLEEAAWYVRDRSRRNGRRSENRVVSRTLLVKGLEFDQSVVLDANTLGAKEAYVAMTRGTRGLSVLSTDSTLQWPAPSNVLA